MVSIKAAKDKVGYFLKLPLVTTDTRAHIHTHTHIYTCVLSCVLSQHLAGSDLQSTASCCSLPQLVDHGVPICSSPRVSRSQSSCIPPSSQDRRRHTENAPQRSAWRNVTSFSCTEPSSSLLSSVGGAWTGMSKWDLNLGDLEGGTGTC